MQSDRQDRIREHLETALDQAENDETKYWLRNTLQLLTAEQEPRLRTEP